MSLDLDHLEMVRRVGGDVIQARCPDCAEAGGDRAGEHLRVHPDGRFGCCVHPKDREQRKRIFALAGDRSRRSFTIRVTHMQPREREARSVKACLSQHGGTVGTAESKSETSGQKASQSYNPVTEPSPPPMRDTWDGYFSPSRIRERRHSCNTYV